MTRHHAEWSPLVEVSGPVADSSKNHYEVTDQLGLQIRRAIQTLIQTIDRLDRDKQRTLLAGFSEETLYHASVTVMMRLVFLLAAEERKLLRWGNEIYHAHYAVSTLRDQLQNVADKQGEDVLKRRYGAWNRLLATFRAVHGGVTQEDLRLPAYGGALFDPDRFPFLEGRPTGTSWKDTESVDSTSLPIDDYTTLHLLRSLQLLETSLSLRALGVEAIGNVYEGLLGQTAKRANGPVISLQGGYGPDVEVEVLENAARAKTPAQFVEYLSNLTGRAASTIQKNLEYRIPQEDERYWLIACDNSLDVYKRVEPWAGLVRKDADKPFVVPPGSVYVTTGTERRATGTHYTPPSLTEPIVKHTLDPLVYQGPADGLPEEQWTLRSPREILQLKVCDLAMGSGAFLVQACRYLSERLVRSWEVSEKQSAGNLVMTPLGELLPANRSEHMLPVHRDERLMLARRYVVDRCLYGVDKNPMAVEIAKLSLWLMTLQNDRPFAFLDHVLKCGDSLVGLISAEQIEAFHFRPVPGKTLTSGVSAAKEALFRARSKRVELESFAVETLDDALRKAALLREADDATADLRLVADVIIGAALSTATKGEKARSKRIEELAPLVADFVNERSPERRAELERRVAELLNEGQKPFHWVIEFPEIFGDRGGFDAFIGNPPFAGKNTTLASQGESYIAYLKLVHEQSHGNADVVAHFFRRSFCLLRHHGTFGLIATNTIAQGDTRSTGLRWICNHGGIIYNATRRFKWPGAAAVIVSIVHAMRGGSLPARLDGKTVERISALLFTEGGHDDPAALAANEGKGFVGSYVLGMGFTFDDTKPDTTPIAEMHRLIDSDGRNAERIFPYLGGDELNSSPTQSPHRYIINFGEMTENQARSWPDLMAIIEAKVKPERLKNNREGYRRHWWHFGEKRIDLYNAIRKMDRVLVCGQTSKYRTFTFVPNRCVFDQKLIVFAFDRDAALCTLHSRVHETWALFFGSTMKDDPVYTPSDCFLTFPFPVHWETNANLDTLGKKYYDFRAALMIKNNEGLTKTYNRFHNPKERSAAIDTLRELHAHMDRAVLDAYGWQQIVPEYDFRKQLDESIRYTWSEDTRDAVLGKLLELNQSRYNEQEAAKQHDKSKKIKVDKPAPAAEPQTGFQFDVGRKSPQA